MTGTCVNGHPWAENVIMRPRSRGGFQRECRACRRRWAAERRDAAFAAQHAGHDITHDATGRRRCLTCRRPGRADTPQRDANIAAMSRAGLSNSDIAARVGVAERTVARILIRTRKDPDAMVRYAPDTLARPDRWRTNAACRETDPEVFFPDPGDALTIAQAKSICARCPVRPTCADDALVRRDQYGIWGGLTESQRRHTLRARALEAKADSGSSP
jgi:hypothetical protein